MDAHQVALVDDLERRMHLLRSARERLESATWVHPGTSTFWSGPAHSIYESRIARLHRALAAAADDIHAAIDTTSLRLGWLRRG